jgi:hypothetical protein
MPQHARAPASEFENGVKRGKVEPIPLCSRKDTPSIFTARAEIPIRRPPNAKFLLVLQRFRLDQFWRREQSMLLAVEMITKSLLQVIQKALFSVKRTEPRPELPGCHDPEPFDQRRLVHCNLPISDNSREMHLLLLMPRTSTQNKQALHVDAAATGGRSSAISRRMSPNKCREMATSAIWKAT